MSVNELIASLLALWLPFVRILAFFLFCPILDNRALPRKARIILAFLLSMIIAPVLEEKIVINDLMNANTLLLTGEQIIWGWLFGQMLWWVFWALQTAGAILSMNMGLGMAVMNDPANGSSTMVISQIIFIWSGLLFFIADGHLLLVSILYKGFIYWPIGKAITIPSLHALASGLGWILSSAVLLALPTVFIMLLVQGTFGLLSRVAPQLNLFALGFPISMLFGLLCFIVLSSHIGEHYLQLTNRVIALFDQLREA